MKHIIAIMLALALPAASAKTPNLLAMNAIQAYAYVHANTRPLGTKFNEQHSFVGPTIREKADHGHALVKLFAVFHPETHDADVFLIADIEYNANLWAFYHSAVLDDGTQLSVVRNDKDFGGCQVDGCDYSEIVDVAITSSVFNSGHADHSLGVRLYGENGVTTVKLPAGYVAGFVAALP